MESVTGRLNIICHRGMVRGSILRCLQAGKPLLNGLLATGVIGGKTLPLKTKSED
jgi:hypothetical protein